LGFNEYTRKVVLDAMFFSDLWPEFDRGKMSDEELLNRFIKNSPSFEREIRTAFEAVGDTIHTYDYSKDWILDMKAKGYHCYYLSNFPSKTYDLSKEKMSFLEDMDGGIFSFEIRSIKPEPLIYETLLQKYSLDPDASVFLDDSYKNIETAHKLGFHTILFKNQKQALSELRKLGIHL
ncbi:MAG TPA: HAD-IA family hydrolase, partial [Candidatus Merdenecus merdavium]|nr:HAD-IA family hydrolase [Candidatus Merdenecus merdavium]